MATWFGDSPGGRGVTIALFSSLVADYFPGLPPPVVGHHGNSVWLQVFCCWPSWRGETAGFQGEAFLFPLAVGEEDVRGAWVRTGFGKEFL